MCVCVTLGIIGILSDFLAGGARDHASLALTKTLALVCEIDLGRQIDVPAIFNFSNGERLSQEPHNTVLRRDLVHFLQMCTSRRHPVRFVAVFDLELLASLLLTDLQVL